MRGMFRCLLYDYQVYFLSGHLFHQILPRELNMFLESKHKELSLYSTSDPRTDPFDYFTTLLLIHPSWPFSNRTLNHSPDSPITVTLSPCFTVVTTG